MHFNFGSPYFLLLLLLLPCFLWCKPYSNIFYFPKLSWVTKESPFFTLDPWFKILLYILMVLALAKPFFYDSTANAHKKGRDLVLAIDASGSMAQSGFDAKDRFKTKYETTLSLSKAFVKQRFDDNMALVIFGTFAYTASPLTYDLEGLNYLLEMTTVGLAGESTAIGDALIQSIHTLFFGKAKSKAIILLTDGFHNAGRNAPKEAVKKAKSLGIKIYTIGIGEQSDYDASLLQTIAKESGGRSFSASSAQALQKVYKEIHHLEPSPIRGEAFLHQRLLIFLPLILLFLFLFLWTLHMQRSKQ